VSFEEVCGHVDAKDGQKRVAVVIDFGVEQDAAEGQEPPAPYAACAQVAPKATGLQVLDAVAEVRSENSDFGPSLCAIDGYPASGPCFGSGPEASPDDGEPVAFAIEGVDKESDDEDDDSNVPLLLGVGAVVVLLGAGGVLLARRNKA
jgi:LPXTG-motif cell wall-anchored protein